MAGQRRTGHPTGPAARRAAPGLALLLTLLAPAAGAASGFASPASARGSEPLDLVFIVDEDVARVAVAEDATCVMRHVATGASFPCPATGSLVVADVQPRGRSYTFHTAAPAAPGTYEATFRRTQLVGVLPGDVVANATFQVIDEGLDSTGGAPAGPDADGDAAPPGPAGADDALRWLVNVMAGTAALVGALVVARRGGSP